MALLAAAALSMCLASPSDALAKGRKPKVVWAEVKLPEARDIAVYQKMMKEILEKESRRARWGKKKGELVEASIVIKELRTETKGDVLHVSCSAAGTIAGLGVAKSRFSYGGLPKDKLALERKVLELVTRGIVARLAELSRDKEEGWKVQRGPAERPPQPDKPAGAPNPDKPVDPALPAAAKATPAKQ